VNGTPADQFVPHEVGVYGDVLKFKGLKVASLLSTAAVPPSRSKVVGWDRRWWAVQPRIGLAAPSRRPAKHNESLELVAEGFGVESFVRYSSPFLSFKLLTLCYQSFACISVLTIMLLSVRNCTLEVVGYNHHLPSTERMVAKAQKRFTAYGLRPMEVFDLGDGFSNLTHVSFRAWVHDDRERDDWCFIIDDLRYAISWREVEKGAAVGVGYGGWWDEDMTKESGVNEDDVSGLRGGFRQVVGEPGQDDDDVSRLYQGFRPDDREPGQDDDDDAGSWHAVDDSTSDSETWRYEASKVN
jgi:hypothetical protein